MKNLMEGDPFAGVTAPEIGIKPEEAQGITVTTGPEILQEPQTTITPGDAMQNALATRTSLDPGGISNSTIRSDENDIRDKLVMAEEAIAHNLGSGESLSAAALALVDKDPRQMTSGDKAEIERLKATVDDLANREADREVRNAEKTVLEVAEAAVTPAATREFPPELSGIAGSLRDIAMAAESVGIGGARHTPEAALFVSVAPSTGIPAASQQQAKSAPQPQGMQRSVRSST